MSIVFTGKFGFDLKHKYSQVQFLSHTQKRGQFALAFIALFLCFPDPFVPARVGFDFPFDLTVIGVAPNRPIVRK